MITACVPEPLDLYYGPKIEKGWRDELHKQFDDWLDTLEEDMRREERKGVWMRYSDNTLSSYMASTVCVMSNILYVFRHTIGVTVQYPVDL